jgi:hypothetical protein
MHEEVARQRQYVGGRRVLAARRAIVGSHDQHVFAGRDQRLGGIQPEAGEASRMIAELFAVQPDAGDAAGGIELEPDALAPHFGGNGEALPIPTQALSLVDRLGTVNVTSGIGPVEPDSVPGVRDRDALPLGVVEAGLDGIRRRITLVEAPILIEDQGRARNCRLPPAVGCLRPAGGGLKTCEQHCCSSQGCKTTTHPPSPFFRDLSLSNLPYQSVSHAVRSSFKSAKLLRYGHPNILAGRVPEIGKTEMAAAYITMYFFVDRARPVGLRREFASIVSNAYRGEHPGLHAISPIVRLLAPSGQQQGSNT